MHNLISQLKESLKGPLPGATSHIKMSPQGRGNTEEYIQTLLSPPRISAVMLLLFAENDPSTGSGCKMVLIKRPDYLGLHSGQISFPGGKFEKTDRNYEHTALRETEEEIGIPINQVELVGALSRIYIPPSNFLVYPFVGYCRQKPIFKIDTKEVNHLILPSIDILLDESIKLEGTFIVGDKSDWKIKAPYFNIEGEKVWGATATILSEFKDILVNIKFQMTNSK